MGPVADPGGGGLLLYFYIFNVSFTLFWRSPPLALKGGGGVQFFKFSRANKIN